MTHPKGENRMPPSFYGRRKQDPKPLIMPPDYKPRPWLSKADVAIFVFVVMACVGTYFWVLR